MMLLVVSYGFMLWMAKFLLTHLAAAHDVSVHHNIVQEVLLQTN